ncbi:hypothetical protein D3C84_1292150 [compost metagenome]
MYLQNWLLESLSIRAIHLWVRLYLHLIELHLICHGGQVCLSLEGLSVSVGAAVPCKRADWNKV